MIRRRGHGEGALVVAVVAMASGLLGCGGAPAERVRIESPSGEVRLEVSVTEARTATERMTGLMGRDALPEDEGLLLVFPVEGEVCIVNDRVPFAIDVVYVDAAGRVTAVEHDVPANDACSTCRCHAPTQRVLEVAAGVAVNVVVGDTFLD